MAVLTKKPIVSLLLDLQVNCMEFKEKLNNTVSLCSNKIKTAVLFVGHTPWVLSLVVGVLLNFTIECLQRHSLWQGILHVVQSPLPFLFNCLIITTVMAICSLFKRRLFLYFFFGALFLGFGIANCVVLAMRITPLEGADLQVVKISLITKYLNGFEIGLVIGVISLAILALVVMCIKFPKAKVNYLKEGISAAIYVAVLLVSLITFRATGILLTDYTKNHADAYKKYGFNYCFLCSVLDTGIAEPEKYTVEDITAITTALETAANNNQSIKNNASLVQNGEAAPNVIFLQLETFFDVNHLSTVEFSEDPIPNFTALHKQFSSGYISVPSIGAGTANTEFEVISGMSLSPFGMGEYPYKTILQNHPCESICYNLKNHGYSTHALHNNTAVFYDRHIVFSNLGFDTFTALEYMQDVEFTPNGWAKDNVLLSNINDCLDSTEGSDFVYTITVQSHGKYPSVYDEKYPISITKGFEDDEDVRKEFEYYINQLNEVDKFVGDLLNSLSERNERTVVVMFGDHLPSFTIDAEDLESGDLFATEYIIWDNIGLEKNDQNLTAHQISAHTLELLGYDDGLLTKLHQNFADDEQYTTWLHTLQYDMLYGENYAYGGKEEFPYKSTQLKLGVRDIIITDVTSDKNEILTVKGENFTEYSRIMIDDSLIDTVFIDNNTLASADQTELRVGSVMAIVQVDSSDTSLSSSKPYLVGGTHDKITVTVDDTRVIYLPQGFTLSTVIVFIVIGIAVISVSIAITVSTLKHRKETSTKSKNPADKKSK